MYPVAPVSLILFVKRISDILLLVIDSDVFVVCRNLLRQMKTHNRAGGWLSSQTKSYPPSDDELDTRTALGVPGFLTQIPTEL
jgi:hypothetical protein